MHVNTSLSLCFEKTKSIKSFYIKREMNALIQASHMHVNTSLGLLVVADTDEVQGAMVEARHRAVVHCKVHRWQARTPVQGVRF
jgi:hypothetical protein